MKREIKFRAWDTIDNKWLFGYEYPNLGGFSIVGEVTLMGELNSVSLERWNDIAIMQFTGKKDKNNKPIYEGDICRVHWGEPNTKPCISAVEWVEETACWGFGAGNTSEVHWSHEVIGNVYEHPNLLKNI